MLVKPIVFVPRAAVLFGTALVFFLACVGGNAPRTPAGAAATGEPAVAADFTLSDVQGRKVSLSDTAGQVRLVDFWATWCAPCREEIPVFKELHKTYGSKGFSIIAISDESAEIIQEFVKENEIPYTNLVDPGEVSTQYEVASLPTAFLLDRDGRIVEEFRGTKPRRILERKIRELLEIPPAT